MYDHLLYSHYLKANLHTDELAGAERVRAGGGVGRGYSCILAIRVCAAGKGMVFKPFSLV